MGMGALAALALASELEGPCPCPCACACPSVVDDVDAPSEAGPKTVALFSFLKLGSLPDGGSLKDSVDRDMDMDDADENADADAGDAAREDDAVGATGCCCCFLIEGVPVAAAAA